MIRKATEKDLGPVAELYGAIHTAEEAGRAVVGWQRGVYPTRATAAAALLRGDLFVLEAEGRVAAAAVINQQQAPAYAACPWQYDAPQEQVMVLHTLAVEPACQGRGYGAAFVAFYEEYALAQGCPYLRMDTNEKNAAARAFYQKRGFGEPGVVGCTFNGIPGVRLVCLEKRL